MQKAPELIWVEEPIAVAATETVAGTIKVVNYEIPSSRGAAVVFVKESMLFTAYPDTHANANTATMVTAALLVGKRTPTTPYPNEPGAFHVSAQQRVTGAGGVCAANWVVGAPVWQGMRQVIREASDRLYYITVAAQGVNNTATKGCQGLVIALIGRTEARGVNTRQVTSQSFGKV